MASPSKSPDLDVEAQLEVLKSHRASHHLSRNYPLSWNVLTIFGTALEEEENHETTNRPSEAVSDASRAPADPAQLAASSLEAKGAVYIFSRLCISTRHNTVIFMNKRRGRRNS